MSQDTPKPRGRPPSKTARANALAAARGILMDHGFGRLTIEAVAAKSGVGKPTIYRNWSNKSELAMAALLPEHPADNPDGKGFSEALGQQMDTLVATFASTRGRQIALALASADPESELTRAFRNRVILSSRDAGRDMILAAIDRGEIAEPEGIETVLDMIYGPVLYRLLAGHQPLDAAFARSLTATALRLLK